MFSKMMAGLRAEAERVNAANCMMLAKSHTNGWELADVVRGTTAKTRTTVAGASLGIGGIVGLMGVALANQAAALGTAGLLSSASATLAGLGTIAVGTAVLPVATVAVLGTAVAGVVTMGLSHFMRENIDKASVFEHAIVTGDRETMVNISKEHLSLGDWLKGAKNFLSNAMPGRLQELQTGVSANVMAPDLSTKPAGIEGEDAFLAYEMEDLFGDSFEDSQKGKQALVEKLGANVWDKLGVAVPDDKLHDCLAGTRGNTLCVGTILDVNTKTGLVVQSLGRGNATVHNLKEFARLPEVGQSLEISYKAGKMQLGQEQGQSRGVGR